ncbi:hypothetical protein [Streptomyces nitrosporeus]|uniref:hypothetical protein n=1 Tax=Streptomyces nitrosporeus TaxID=28894 RepID=UPI00167F0251|nr:hypothetical protein [Streptomyces nitrosporeus]GGZ18632.1 hypothetical protein GCM10010327_57270 [Streptomyces nitrosporeus]
MDPFPLTEAAMAGLALGVAGNALYAVGAQGITKATQAMMWLTRREKNRDTTARTLTTFTQDARELADVYANTTAINWSAPDYQNLVDEKTPTWGAVLAAHLAAHPEAQDDFAAFAKHGMNIEMDFTSTTVGRDMAVVNAVGAIGNANGATITINNHPS